MSYKDLNKIDSKIDKERIREKDSNALKVIESVFDFQTSMTLVKLMNKGILKDISHVISTGKEANVYHAYSSKKEEFAIKIYRTTTAEFKKNWIYVQGDPRFKKYKKGTYSFIYTWAKKEFKNLKRMLKAGIPVPKPEIVNKNIIIMITPIHFSISPNIFPLPPVISACAETVGLDRDQISAQTLSKSKHNHDFK